jgi:hypothetical protein
MDFIIDAESHSQPVPSLVSSCLLSGDMSLFQPLCHKGVISGEWLNATVTNQICATVPNVTNPGTISPHEHCHNGGPHISSISVFHGVFQNG